MSIFSTGEFTDSGNFNRPELSLVIPCLNEQATIGACIEEARKTLISHQICAEIIVANNGSTDESGKIARSMGAQVVEVENRGYGNAIMGGITASQGTYIIMADADGSYDFGDIPAFLKALRSGYEVVIGNRFLGGIARGAMPFLHRYFGNPVLTGIGRCFFESPCRDFHCGMRGFSRAAYARMGLRSTGMEFASEMVVKASLLKLKTCEIPTTLSPAGRAGNSHLRTWHDGWRHLRFLLLYSPRWLFLYPGFAIMAAGLLAALWLLPGPRTIGKSVVDIHTLLYSVVAILTGFQAVMFAIFTKVFGITEGFLPEDSRLSRAFKIVNLELGLITGAASLIIGIGIAIYSFLLWNRTGFGPMNPNVLVRIVAAAMVAMTLGVELIFSSFFLSILGMMRK